MGRRVGKRRPPAALLIAGGIVSLMVVVPLADTVEQALQLSWDEAVALLWRPLIGELLVNTLMLIAATTTTCAVIGTAAAWCVERTVLPFSRGFAMLAAVPLAIPAFISSYAWISLSPALQDFAGAWLVVGCAYYPMVYLPVAAALRGCDPALEETGRALGLGPWSSFWRIVLPQLRPALLGGMLLVALNTLTEFGAFALLRYRTFTTEIYTQYRVGIDGPPAAVLAVLLIVLCVLCLVLEWRVRGPVPLVEVARSARRRSRRLPLGRWRVPVVAALGLLVAVSLGVPLGMIGFWLTRHGHAATSPSLADAASLARAAGSSIHLGLAGAALTLVLALPLGVLATRFGGGFVTLLERCAYLAQGVPGIVVALALVSLTVQAAPVLYQGAALLVFAYAVLFLPLALVSVRAAVTQAQPGLEEAGRVLGLNWWQVLLRIAGPLAAPGLGAAAALVFISIVTELTATLLLAPIGTRTLATEVWSNTSALAFAAAAPYAALMAGLSLTSTWLLARRFGRTVVLGGPAHGLLQPGVI